MIMEDSGMVAVGFHCYCGHELHDVLTMTNTGYMIIKCRRCETVKKIDLDEARAERMREFAIIPTKEQAKSFHKKEEE